MIAACTKGKSEHIIAQYSFSFAILYTSALFGSAYVQFNDYRNVCPAINERERQVI